MYYMYYQHQNHEKILTFWKGAGDVSTYSTDTGTVMYSWTLMIEQLDSPPFRFFFGTQQRTHYSKSPKSAQKIWILGMTNYQKLIFRVTYILQIRVGWILQIPKIQTRFLSKSTFLDKNWIFNIVWGAEGYFEYAKDSSSVFFSSDREQEKKNEK